MNTSRRRLLELAIAMPVFISQARAADMAPTTSRVYPGIDGRLNYQPDEFGNTIHDASHAGYGGGGAAIPTLPVRERLWPVPGENAAHLQAAIDRVAAMAPDANGFRGALLLRAGYYRMATSLRIQASGIVLRGEGMGDTGTILVGTGTGRPPAVAGQGPGQARRDRGLHHRQPARPALGHARQQRPERLRDQGAGAGQGLRQRLAPRLHPVRRRVLTGLGRGRIHVLQRYCHTR